MSKYQKLTGLLLLLVAFGLLIPSITKPILVLQATVDKGELMDFGKQVLAENPEVPELLVSLSQQLIDRLKVEGELEVFSRSRSITGTVDELYQSGNALVAFLIALFSIIIPALKLTLLLVTSC